MILHRIVSVNSDATLEHARRLVEASSKHLKGLSLYGVDQTTDTSDTSLPPEERLQDTPGHSGKIVRHAFSHYLNRDAKFSADSLNINYISLLNPTNWFRVIDATVLVDLQLFKCPGAAEALHELCQIHTTDFKLRTFALTHYESSSGSRIERALKIFLNKFAGLRLLYIEVCCVESFDCVKDVAKHATTLRNLRYLDTKVSANGKSPTSSLDFLQVIAQNCPNLEELVSSQTRPECLTKYFSLRTTT